MRGLLHDSSESADVADNEQAVFIDRAVVLCTSRVLQRRAVPFQRRRSTAGYYLSPSSDTVHAVRNICLAPTMT